MKRTITLEIAGTKFRLVADTDEMHLQELADLVNDRVGQLTATGAKSASSAQLLALAALGLADDLKTSRARLKQVDQLTRTAVTNAITRIDNRISSDMDGDG